MIKCIFIGGPTAVGKTQVSISLAKYLKCDIISADSRQIYKELNIGVAKPSKQVLTTVNHHGINLISVTEAYNAGLFETFALDLIESFQQEYIIVTGGTGLYLSSIMNGLDRFPEIDQEVVLALNQQYENGHFDQLVTELSIKDPAYAKIMDLQNSRRVLRALSVIRQTGKPFSSFFNQPKRVRPFRSICLSLNMDREKLYSRINQRVDQMIDKGLIREVQSLLKYRDLKALKTVGYNELFKYFDEENSLDFSISEIKKNSRRYAKRQLTWLNKYFDFPQFSPDNIDGILTFIKNQ